MTGVAALAQRSGSEKFRKGLAIAAAGEWVADKLPFVPARVAPAGLAGRVLFGAVCGGIVAKHRGENPALGMAVGVIGATAAAFGAYYLRKNLARRGVPDFAVALVEDAVAAGLAARGAGLIGDHRRAA